MLFFFNWWMYTLSWVDWPGMCNNLLHSFTVFLYWNWKARAHFHVLATLWGGRAVLAMLCPVSLWNASNLDKFAGRGEGGGLLSPLRWNERRLHTQRPPKSLGSFPSDYLLSWEGSMQQFQQCWWPLCLQLSSTAHFSLVGCSSNWQASKASRELGTCQDNSVFLWSEACLEVCNTSRNWIKWQFWINNGTFQLV